MSLFVKLFIFAMFIAFAMAQFPEFPIPEGIIPAGLPIPGAGGAATEAPAAEAKKNWKH
jgi:hypothetical protein